MLNRTNLKNPVRLRISTTLYATGGINMYIIGGGTDMHEDI